MNQIDKVEGSYSPLLPSLSLLFILAFLYFNGNDREKEHAIARQLPITTVVGLLETVFSVGSVPRLYNEDPKPAECSSVE
jgi:hypothetical protein